MVPQQVLRLALILTAGAAGTARAQAPRTPLPDGEPVIVIDLRPGDAGARGSSREQFTRALAGVRGVQLIADVELTAALAGEPSDEVGRKATAELQRARTAAGKQDCATARAAARAAVDGLAAALAAGEPVSAALIDAHAIDLTCADAAGDHAAAQRAAHWLRQLRAAEPPPGVDAAVWGRYPAIDAAADRDLVEITIDAPPGAEVWLDHRSIGKAPVNALTGQGEHLVAVTAGRARAATRTVVEAEGTKLSLTPAEPGQRWATAAAAVRAWRDGGASANALALGHLMAEVGVRIAVVLAGSGQAEVWGRGRTDAAARRVASGHIDQPFPVGAAIVDQVATWEGPSVTDEPIVSTRPDKRRRKWWVYAGILGAVGLAAGVVLVNDLAVDTQRIEIRWP